jgi:hypothetical protein
LAAYKNFLLGEIAKKQGLGVAAASSGAESFPVVSSRRDA